ncbi:MAG: Gfo/Idh/MocA family oxidoreductase [Eubacteriales bacterium]|nr:Gfo/Idh/MocA family oxidoreductase [Eubacteriales bacterium]
MSQKRVKVALVGCGRIAAKHLKALRYQEKRGRCSLVAVADRNQEQGRDNLKIHYPESERVDFYSGLEELLAQETVDLVVITTPSGSHRDLALTAISQGMHLLVEKPLAMNLEDAVQIQQAAEQAGVKLALGHIYRYFPVMQDLRGKLAAGAFGKIYYGTVVVRWGHDQAYYDATPWRGTRAADGGVILNQSVHALDLMRWLLVAEDQEILTCQGQATTQSHQMESEDLAFGIFEFANGSYLSYEGSTSTQEDYHEARFFICTEKADIRAGIKKGKPYISIRQDGKDYGKAYLRNFLWRQAQEEGLASLGSLTNPHTAIYTDLLAAINEGREPLADARSGVSSLEMVTLLYRACGIEA